MRRAGVVALNTFREAVRDRVLYNLVFFALLMIAASVAVFAMPRGPPIAGPAISQEIICKVRHCRRLTKSVLPIV